MEVPFWGTNPNIILDKKYITELWPSNEMSYNQKLNAISRTIIFLTFIGLFIKNRVKVLVTSAITLGIIFLIHKKVFVINREGYENENKNTDLDINISEEQTIPTVINPLMNVLPNEIRENPNRGEASKSYLDDVAEDINNNTKEQIKQINHDNKDIDKKLFKNLGDNLEFEHSMRNYYTMPNTTVPNNQEDFAYFCYGNMGHDKEKYQKSESEKELML